MTEDTKARQDEQVEAPMEGETALQVETPAQAESAPQTEPLFHLVLASASPRRRELLEAKGIPFEVRPMDVDEELDPDLAADPFEAAKKIAERKAGAAVQALLDENPGGIWMVLGADTMVVLDGKVYGKPKSHSDAKHILRTLSGRTHQVMTGVSIWMVAASADDPEKLSVGFRSFTDVTHVTFKTLEDRQIEDYISTGKVYDKAGAYGIQDGADIFVERIDGYLDTVIGLPLERIIQDFPELLEL